MQYVYTHICRLNLMNGSYSSHIFRTPYVNQVMIVSLVVFCGCWARARFLQDGQ